MFTLSAFADEISADPQEQVDALLACDIRHIEFRSILKTNVLSLSDLQIDEFRSLLDRKAMKLSAIGSPLGKVRIDEPFAPHLEKLDRAIDLAKRFGTPNIRIFSFYPPEGLTDAAWPRHRGEVLRRLSEMIERAETAGVRLVHENEHRIYGDSPDRFEDLLSHLFSPAFGAAFDPANFVYCGYDPWDGWLQTRTRVVHFHIKDWKAGDDRGCPAGEGGGKIPQILADAVQRGYHGFATLEPHLLGGGPTGGVTGPELFPSAVAALRKIMADVGAIENTDAG